MTDLAVIFGFGLAVWIVNTQIQLEATTKRKVSIVMLILLVVYVLLIAFRHLNVPGPGHYQEHP